MSPLLAEVASDGSVSTPSVFMSPQLGQTGTTFDSREHFIEHCKRTAASFGFHLASRGSYPKKIRQDICFACTVGRNYKRPKKNNGVSEPATPAPGEVVQAPCPVAVTAKWQVNPDGTLVEGGKFEITQSQLTHNHSPIVHQNPTANSFQSSPTVKNPHSKTLLNHPRPAGTPAGSFDAKSSLNNIDTNPSLESDSAEYQNPNRKPHSNLTTAHSRLNSTSDSHTQLDILPSISSSPPVSSSSASNLIETHSNHSRYPSSSHDQHLIMQSASYPRQAQKLASATEQGLYPDPPPDESIHPHLPRVGEIFKSWDDFRTYARQGAEARGFALSQSQSKGSSGTIVLRCSRFKEPGTAGQKMAENGCEAVYKVMKAKNGVEGFEVVQVNDRHNHPYGPHVPFHNPSRAHPSSNGSGAPKRKRVKSAHVPANPTEGFAAYDSAGPSSIAAGATPPAAAVANTMSAPKPFLFDPYTGKPLRSSDTPAPTAPGSSDHASPSPPSNRSEEPVPAAGIVPPAKMLGQLPYYYIPPTQNGEPTNYATEATMSGYEKQKATLLNTITPMARNVKRPANHDAQSLLNIRLSIKAQVQIVDFLTSLAPTMAAYGPHFIWIGIRSPVDLLEIEDQSGQAELECLFDELDTSGMGGTGEGMGTEEKVLMLKGLKKLRSIREKANGN
ncbi:uncharacterized protein MELLADRAFT_77367 [Melampsora larici-populina 98AG31]|uniref:FAR1 domain-containing protein n=1 Tax=Melampsora larici-populina (strain 98AG31 / pathotype 3-4-7) TaxID=747676 RepID=F4RGP7_MELLP|nr:uncharacterized protein MELLADRAFT_77367 [Melampsora larici-populina 98AG31]EGG08587.1 hypothetical protein MELLADRAFT_77367 [Melampsora larici-populina 98AG31]